MITSFKGTKLAMAENWLQLVASWNPTGGAFELCPGTLFPNSRGNIAAVNLSLYLDTFKFCLLVFGMVVQCCTSLDCRAPLASKLHIHCSASVKTHTALNFLLIPHNSIATNTIPLP